MAKELYIDIDGTHYPMKFGWGACQYLGEYLGESTYDGTVQKVGHVVQTFADQEKNGGALPFDAMNTLAYMMMSGIRNHLPMGEKLQLELDQVVGVLIQDVDSLADKVSAFMDALPRPKNGTEKGNAKAPKRGRSSNHSAGTSSKRSS